ncbi:MAG: IS21 family transposase [Syntrophobacteraceae bacterium]|nr:IS21 family transposase [Syntrophobacteraceae bacterium]
MIDFELFSTIRNYHEQKGLSANQIADELGLDLRTVSKWLQEKRFRERAPVMRPSTLDPFKGAIVRMLEAHQYSAAQILQRIREEGFKGGYTIVKEYVRKVRPKRSPAFLKLAFAPGECARVDWGSLGTIRTGESTRRLSFFVMVLCYSRMMYLEFTVSQTMEHWLACHQNAFDAFGSVPGKIMVDNLKSAVLKRIVGHAPVFNPKYLDFANHFGFKIAPCGVGKGNEKGRVENGVGYVKKNLLAGLELPQFDAMGNVSRQWLDTIANVRIHGETRKKPVEMFSEEKQSLLPLPAHPYDIGTITRVRASTQFRVTLDSNHYSVPAEYAGANLTLKAYPDRLCIYCGDKLIARHPRSYDRNIDFEDPDHPKALLAQRKKAREQKLYMRFLFLSQHASDYYRELEKRRMNPRHHVQKIVALSEIYGAEPVARAMEDAFHFQAFSCEYIANLCEQRTRRLPEPGALMLTRRADLLELEVQRPDLSIYQKESKKDGIDGKK